MTTASFVLAGCGGGNDLDGIEVSKADTPKVTVEEDYTATKTESRVVSKGGGDEVADGDTIKINYVAVNGRTGKEFDNSFKNETPMTLTLNKKTALPGFYKGLVGQDIGSRVLVSVPSKDGASLLQSVESLGMKKDDTMVFLFDLVSKVPTEAKGKAVAPSATLPKLTFDKDKHPAKFVKTKKTAPLKKSGLEVLIKGTGDPVAKGATLSVHYVGQKYPAGQVFDESWSTGPRQISIAEGSVAPCWSDLIPGNTVGSRVVVTCTVEDGFGKNAKKEGKPDGPLIFVVDLLDAS
ncbi:peptidylprolyl isomerase [Aeromicrobium flavum]|uniref:Peptidyl-prolyl cis-trans isomerase n=1 Tax=Aeromicrobium flavum TaxID=416568 RepID=A0A512HUM7_9ACTN|nr:FKBP-type peptidyl-prolyl cis-trans isomerase [Aeromicrobium flavum]GEO89153.1 peptidylprolyl isomerase [Aeromicrobium flavum]